MTLANERRTNDPVDLLARIAELESLIQQLSISPWFGCLTRNALNIVLTNMDLTDVWACFFDLDHLKKHNLIAGKPTVSANVASVIRTRHNDLLAEGKSPIIGQWFSGDEFVGLFTQQDALGYAQRVQNGLHTFGMSATFVLLPIEYKRDPFMTLNYADNVATKVKDRGYRNIIIDVTRG